MRRRNSSVYPIPRAVSSEAQDPAKTLRTLNGLLRGEISAAQTYHLAIPRVAGRRAGDIERLRTIAREHDSTAREIRAVIERIGGTPDDAGTIWPTVVKGVRGPGRVFVEAAALKALKEGEEQSLEEYRAALEQLNAESGNMVRNSIIPSREKHIDELNEMIARL